MIESAKFDTSNLMGVLNGLHKVTGASGKSLVKRSMKIAISRAIDLTPPAHKGAMGNEAKLIGEKKIQGDIRRLFASASYAFETIKDQKKARLFWRLTKGQSKDLARAQEVLRANSYNQKLRNAELTETMDQSIHKKFRSHGVVGKSRTVQQIIVSRASKNNPVEKYIKQKQKMVGLWAAGWLGIMKHIGSLKAVPKWIRRHIEYGSKFTDVFVEDEADGSYYISAENSTKYGSLNRIIPYAEASAFRAMKKELEIVKAKAIAKAGLKK